jgi:hypothetical protein
MLAVKVYSYGLCRRNKSDGSLRNVEEQKITRKKKKLSSGIVIYTPALMFNPRKDGENF